MANTAIHYQEPTKLLYSVSDAARMLSCSRSTVYSFIKAGQILAVYPTSKARVSATSLIRFVELKEREARENRAVLSQGAK
jgi:excisionase family DNA binding protein